MVQLVNGPYGFYFAFTFNWLIFNYRTIIRNYLKTLPSLSFYFSSSRVGSMRSHPAGAFLVREVVIFGIIRIYNN